MIISQLQFAGVFMFLTALLLIATIYSNIHWSFKAILTLSSIVFCLFAFSAYEDSEGYPINARPPAKFEYVGSFIRPPNPITNDAGKIYLWIIDRRVSDLPRVIAIPYTKEQQKVMDEAKQRKSQKQRVLLGHDNSPGTPTFDFIQPEDTVPTKEH